MMNLFRHRSHVPCSFGERSAVQVSDLRESPGVHPNLVPRLNPRRRHSTANNTSSQLVLTLRSPPTLDPAHQTTTWQCDRDRQGCDESGQIGRRARSFELERPHSHTWRVFGCRLRPNRAHHLQQLTPHINYYERTSRTDSATAISFFLFPRLAHVALNFPLNAMHGYPWLSKSTATREIHKYGKESRSYGTSR